MNVGTLRPPRRLVCERMAHVHINIGTAFD